MRWLPDLLTGLRFLLAGLIAWTAWARTPQTAMGLLVLLTLAAWTTDALDGPLARRVAGGRESWIGAHDLEVDLSVALAMTFSLAVWEGAPALILVGGLLLCVIAALALRTLAPVHLAMGLVDALFILMAWRQEPLLGWSMVIWIGAVVVATRPRVQTQVLNFLADCRDILSG